MEAYLHSPIVFMGWCLVKHGGNFTVTILRVVLTRFEPTDLYAVALRINLVCILLPEVRTYDPSARFDSPRASVL
jgi:hypothetical protein